jgi:hypothetical protein
MIKFKRPENQSVDPLYVIFEQHLCNFDDSNIDRSTFVLNIVKEYVSHLRSLSIAIPTHLEAHVAEELAEQVKSMLFKRIYGFHDIQEFRVKGLTKEKKSEAKRKYRKVKP